MTGITAGNQRETVKDMVLADYRVPKGVSTQPLQSQKLCSQTKSVTLGRTSAENQNCYTACC